MRSLVNTFDSVERDMRRFLDSFSNSGSAMTPRCDILDRDSHYIVSLDIPGVPKDNIELDVSHGQLRVSTQRESETTGNDYSERSFGRFERSFSLPENTATDQIEASYENGVLSIAIPKVKHSHEQKTKIDIHEGKKEGAWRKLPNQAA